MKHGMKICRIINFIMILAIVSCFWPSFALRAETDETGTDDRTVLKVWYPWADDETIYNKCFRETIEEFNAGSDRIRLETDGMNEELYREKLSASIAQNEIPDIFVCYPDAYLQNVVQSGKILNLTEYLDETYYTGHNLEWEDSVSFENQIYGMDFGVEIGVFLVNRVMLNQYGYQMPESWQEFMELCESFVENGIIPLACADDVTMGFRMYLEMLVHENESMERCGQILEGKEPATEHFGKGVERFFDLVKAGAFGDTQIKRNRQQAEAEFLRGKIPIYFTKSSFVGEILQKNSPLYGKTDIMILPEINEKTGLGGISEVFVVNSSVEDPEETVHAVQVIAETFADRLYQKGACIPTWNSRKAVDPVKDPLYQDMIAFYEEREFMPWWENYLSARRAVRFIERSAELFHMQISVEEFLEGMQNW